MYPVEIEEVFFTIPGKHGNWQLIKMIYLPVNLFWFRGHFPDQPILPGVAQLNWAIEWGKARAESFLPKGELLFLHADPVKFQRPLQPDQMAELVMQWDEEKQILRFDYYFCADGDVKAWAADQSHRCSSGKVQFKIIESAK